MKSYIEKLTSAYKKVNHLTLYVSLKVVDNKAYYQINDIDLYNSEYYKFPYKPEYINKKCLRINEFKYRKSKYNDKFEFQTNELIYCVNEPDTIYSGSETLEEEKLNSEKSNIKSIPAEYNVDLFKQKLVMTKLLLLIYKDSLKNGGELGNREYNEMFIEQYISETKGRDDNPYKDLLTKDFLMLPYSHIYREANGHNLILMNSSERFQKITCSEKIISNHLGLNYNETYEHIEHKIINYIRTDINKSLLLDNKILFVININYNLKNFVRYYREDF
jgi:hypothetical protein